MALLIKPDGSHEELTPAGEDDRLTYDQIRAAIGGGYVQHIETDAESTGYAHMYMDEEGKLKGMEPNWEATKLSVFTAPHDILVGNVVVCNDAEDMRSE